MYEASERVVMCAVRETNKFKVWGKSTTGISYEPLFVYRLEK